MIRWLDGFDHYGSTDGTKVYTAVADFGVAGPGRYNNGQYMRLRYNNGNSIVKTFSNHARWTVGFALNIIDGTLSMGDGTILQLLDGASVQCTLCLANTGNRVLSLYRGAYNTTLLSLGTFVFNTSAWYYIELDYLIDPSGGSWEVRINGVTEFSGTGNTRATANTQAASILMKNAANSEIRIDDLYVADGNPAGHVGFLGEIAVVTKYPNGAGAHTDWTPSAGSNYQCVDETPQNNDTDYVASGTPNQIDTYKYPTMVDAQVLAVAPTLIARKDDAGARVIAPVFRHSNGTEEVGASKGLLDNFMQYQEIWEKNPVTDLDWVASEIADGEFGVKLVA